jgi:uncharacterized protein YbjT (DUF2867 family)
MPKVLAVGGTGMLGRPVVVTLINDGFAVRVFSTDTNRARRHFGDNVEYASGNVGDVDSLRRAMEGCDFVYVNLKGGPTNADFIRVEETGAKNVYAAAKAAGTKKLIQISEARADDKHAFFIVEKVKVEAEKALKSSGLNHVLLKPTWFCESLPLMLGHEKATLVGSGKSTFHFLSSADYAEIVSKCFATDQADGKSLVIFGPESMSLREALERFLSIAYPDVKISRVPLFMARLAAAFSFNKDLRSIVNLMAFFDKNDDSGIVGSPAEADRLFGRSPTTVEEYARMYRKIVKGE